MRQGNLPLCPRRRTRSLLVRILARRWRQAAKNLRGQGVSRSAQEAEEAETEGGSIQRGESWRQGAVENGLT